MDLENAGNIRSHREDHGSRNAGNIRSHREDHGSRNCWKHKITS